MVGNKNCFKKVGLSNVSGLTALFHENAKPNATFYAIFTSTDVNLREKIAGLFESTSLLLVVLAFALNFRLLLLYGRR